MKRSVSFATGNIWRQISEKNQATAIDFIKKLGVDGVEITLATKEEVYNFRLNPSQKDWLAGLDYNSIHAPFRLIRDAKNQEEVEKQLEHIERLYKQIKAKNVIIHPLDIPAQNILDSYKIKVSTENLPKKRHVTIPMLREILRRHSEMGLCLDVAHAYSWSKNETLRLVKSFKNKITQVHLSARYRNRDHKPLKLATLAFMKSIEPIMNLNVPVVIEGGADNTNVRAVQEEIRRVKSLF